MNAPSSRILATLIAGLLAVASPHVLASGGGGFTQPSSMPSQSEPSYDPAVDYRKGVDALKTEQYGDAESAFGRALRATPRDANTRFMMGLAQSGQGKYSDARGQFEKAVKYDDSLVLAHAELGVTLVKLGATDKAKAVLDDLKKRSAACAGNCPQAKDLQAGQAKLESALAPGTAPASSPASPPTTQVSPERELLDRSIASGDRDYLDAVALINEKRYEDAIVALNASARVFGPHPDILTYLGYANRKLGRLDIAEDYYRQALAAAPDHLGATEYYGELMVVRGDLDGARRMLAKLEDVCHFGCAQADELRRWVVAGKPPSS